MHWVWGSECHKTYRFRDTRAKAFSPGVPGAVEFVYLLTVMAAWMQAWGAWGWVPVSGPDEKGLERAVLV